MKYRISTNTLFNILIGILSIFALGQAIIVFAYIYKALQ